MHNNIVILSFEENYENFKLFLEIGISYVNSNKIKIKNSKFETRNIFSNTNPRKSKIPFKFPPLNATIQEYLLYIYI